MTRHIGMTGTRSGMSQTQKETFKVILRQLQITRDIKYFHHGDCMGADAEGHDIATELGFRTVVHPPIKDEVRAYKKGHDIRTEKSYFARNRDIVDESSLMLATPVTDFETLGGTWYTINYAKKKKKELIIINPDGSTVSFEQRVSLDDEAYDD